MRVSVSVFVIGSILVNVMSMCIHFFHNSEVTQALNGSNCCRYICQFSCVCVWLLENLTCAGLVKGFDHLVSCHIGI